MYHETFFATQDIGVRGFTNISDLIPPTPTFTSFRITENTEAVELHQQARRHVFNSVVDTHQGNIQPVVFPLLSISSARNTGRVNMVELTGRSDELLTHESNHEERQATVSEQTSPASSTLASTNYAHPAAGAGNPDVNGYLLPIDNGVTMIKNDAAQTVGRNPCDSSREHDLWEHCPARATQRNGPQQSRDGSCAFACRGSNANQPEIVSSKGKDKSDRRLYQNDFTGMIPFYCNQLSNGLPRGDAMHSSLPVRNESPYTLAVSKRCEVPPEHLCLLHKIGGGSFGQVWKGVALDVDGQQGWSPVAIKMLKGTDSLLTVMLCERFAIVVVIITLWRIQYDRHSKISQVISLLLLH